MSDFETVRNGGRHLLDIKQKAALDRIEAEVERLRAELKSTHDYAEVVRQEGERLLNEVERLRDGPMAQVNAELRAEVERLRAALEAVNANRQHRLDPMVWEQVRAALAPEMPVLPMRPGDLAGADA